MNHIYKVIWSRVKNSYVVVSEIAGTARKSGRQRSHISFLIQKPSFIFRMPAAIKRRTMSVTTMDAPVGIDPM